MILDSIRFGDLRPCTVFPPGLAGALGCCAPHPGQVASTVAQTVGVAVCGPEFKKNRVPQSWRPSLLSTCYGKDWLGTL
jgi:hypothetical protein